MLAPSFFLDEAMASKIEIYNRALSRIGNSQFVADPQEKSKAGEFYRLWYDDCVQMTLRDFPWNFASSVVALSLLDGDVPPGWQYKYAYPTDCLNARVITDARGMRTIAYDYVLSWDCDSLGFVSPPRQTIPFQIMSEAPTDVTRRRLICTDMPQAYLFYTANVTDPNQFDASFKDALEWRIAAEIAAPFLGAPAGQQVANAAGQQYRLALMKAKAQTLNESGEDYRPDSVAVAARL